MTKHEILYFGFIILFFLIISLVNSSLEKTILRWALRFKAWRNSAVVIFLLTIIGYLIEPDVTRKIISFIIKILIVIFNAFAAAMDSVAQQASI